MLSKLTSVLTMTAMLLHAVLGCCAHHAHGCEHGLSVEECQAEHVEHHPKEAEVAHASHSNEGHAGCSSHGDSSHGDSSHGDDGDHESRDDLDGMQVTADEEHDSSPLPQDPCQQDCDGGDCRFTQSSEVKPPSQNDGRLCCPSALAAFSMAASCRFAFEHLTEESRPPRALATGCCRHMTQVWRL